MSIIDLLHTDYIDYLTMRRDAYISALEQSEEGRDYLERAWLSERTDIDRAELRRLFGRR